MTTNPPGRPGTARGVPDTLDPGQRERVRELLQSQRWVLRGEWEGWLRGDRPDATVAIEDLTRDHCVAAAAWLRQQRHSLYRALEGDLMAPEGWLEGLPLYRGLTARHSTLRG